MDNTKVFLKVQYPFKEFRSILFSEAKERTEDKIGGGYFLGLLGSEHKTGMHLCCADRLTDRQTHFQMAGLIESHGIINCNSSLV